MSENITPTFVGRYEWGPEGGSHGGFWHQVVWAFHSSILSISVTYSKKICHRWKGKQIEALQYFLKMISNKENEWEWCSLGLIEKTLMRTSCGNVSHGKVKVNRSLDRASHNECFILQKNAHKSYVHAVTTWSVRPRDVFKSNANYHHGLQCSMIYECSIHWDVQH